jgi:hypothetical protein
MPRPLFADTRPADELAKLPLSVLLGIRVLARTRPQREVLEGAANGVLALLGNAPKSFWIDCSRTRGKLLRNEANRCRKLIRGEAQ